MYHSYKPPVPLAPAALVLAFPPGTLVMQIEHELRKVPLFKGLSPNDLTQLAGRLALRTVPAAVEVVSKGNVGSSMFVVVSGAVRIFLPTSETDEAPILLKELGPGGFFGEMALLERAPRAASVETLEESLLGELSHEGFVDFLQSSSHATMAMLAEMSGRLRATTRQLEFPAARDINREADEKLTWGQHLADRVAQWNGSWSFVVLLCALTLLWCVLNLLQPFAFDPYPYQFFNLFLAVLVALQGPLIMMSQNRQSQKERLHAETDYLVNLKNEIGIAQILRELTQLKEQLPPPDGPPQPP
jgi:CRP/FNR family cyclic AMP-dependent transcriptional regulator